MVKEEDCTKIGSKYYLNTDIQSIFDKRFESVIPDEE
jgi:hypothetical protein